VFFFFFFFFRESFIWTASFGCNTRAKPFSANRNREIFTDAVATPGIKHDSQENTLKLTPKTNAPTHIVNFKGCTLGRYETEWGFRLGATALSTAVPAGLPGVA